MKWWGAALVVCGLWSDSSADNPTPERAESTARQVIDGRYQRANAGPSEPSKPTQLSPSPVQRDKPSQDRRLASESPRAGGGVGSLIWVVLAIVVILAIVAVVLSPTSVVDSIQIAAPDEAPKAPAPVAAKVSPPAPLERPLQNAEQLAAAGKFAEAIHTLLGQTLHELNVAANRTIKASQTSREIAKQVKLAPSPAQSLLGLINAVERTYFGDDIPTAEDYAACRNQFELFVKTYRAAPHQGGRA